MAVRVAQWATGAVGRAALQELIENPDYQLVGVLVYDPAKAGQDAGALCGLPPTTGVLATTDKDEIIALRADVVVHAASKAHAIETNAEDICRLLPPAPTSSLRPPTTTCPPTAPRPRRHSPKHVAQAGPASTPPGRTLVHVRKTRRHSHRTEQDHRPNRPLRGHRCVGRGQQTYAVYLMGMGRPPEDVSVDSPIIKKLDMAYRQALNATADVLGITLSHVEVSVDATTLDHDIEVLAGTIEAGTVVGQRFSWVGHWSDRPLLAIHEEWVLTRDLPQWGLKPLEPGEKAPQIRAVIKRASPASNCSSMSGGTECHRPATSTRSQGIS